MACILELGNPNCLYMTMEKGKGRVPVFFQGDSQKTCITGIFAPFSEFIFQERLSQAVFIFCSVCRFHTLFAFIFNGNSVAGVGVIPEKQAVSKLSKPTFCSQFT